MEEVDQQKYINTLQYRQTWASTRSILETSSYKQKNGKRSRSHWGLFVFLLRIFVRILKLVGLYDKGIANAKNIRIKHIHLNFSDLPKSFDGFKILHLSDLHIDFILNFEDIIIDKIKEEVDLCLVSGDFRSSLLGNYRDTLSPLRKLFHHIKTKYGIYAVLGNHDSYLLADFDEFLGIKMLINESINIEKNGERIYITGTDDPYYYFTEQAQFALELSPLEGFKIALIHSPELHKVAAKNNYSLYLCGHTHGGQICLPGGRPIISHQFDGKKFDRGLWKSGDMIGYTHNGCGVSGIPLRFNSSSEIVFFELNSY